MADRQHFHLEYARSPYVKSHPAQVQANASRQPLRCQGVQDKDRIGVPITKRRLAVQRISLEASPRAGSESMNAECWLVVCNDYLDESENCVVMTSESGAGGI